MNIQRRNPELGRKCRAVIDPGLQRCGPIHACMLHKHLPKLGASQPASLPRFYVARSKPSGCARGTRSPTRIVKSHSVSSPFLVTTQEHQLESPGLVWSPAPLICTQRLSKTCPGPILVRSTLPAEAFVGPKMTSKSQEIANMPGPLPQKRTPR